MNSLEMSVSEKPFFEVVKIIKEPLREKCRCGTFIDINNNVLSPATFRMFVLQESVCIYSKQLVNSYDKR